MSGTKEYIDIAELSAQLRIKRSTLYAMVVQGRIPHFKYLIAAEMVVGDVGFGYRIKIQSRLLNMNVVYPYLCLLASIGFGMDSALKLLQRRLCPWYENG